MIRPMQRALIAVGSPANLAMLGIPIFWPDRLNIAVCAPNL